MSESRPGRTFAFRWRFRLFRCHGCGKRLPSPRDGVLTRLDDGRLQWGCTQCYHAAFRRADS